VLCLNNFIVVGIGTDLKDNVDAVREAVSSRGLSVREM